MTLFFDEPSISIFSVWILKLTHANAVAIEERKSYRVSLSVAMSRWKKKNAHKHILNEFWNPISQPVHHISIHIFEWMHDRKKTISRTFFSKIWLWPQHNDNHHRWFPNMSEMHFKFELELEMNKTSAMVLDIANQWRVRKRERNEIFRHFHHN